MLKLKKVLFSFLSAIPLLVFATPIIAGGGPVEFTVNPNTSLNPGEQYIVHARVYADGTYPTYCKNCYIKLGLQNPQDGDYIAQDSEKTNNDGRIYAKVISRVPGIRTVYVVELKSESGTNITANSTVNLNYGQGSNSVNNPTPTAVPSNIPMPGAPDMVYPVDGQTLDLEGAYMFKVRPVEGSTGYLFGLFQDGQMVYENYRDTRTLSSNGEFALWENNPTHTKFHTGPVSVWIRAYVRNQWTDARIITINLRPRGGNIVVQPSITPQPVAQQTPSSTVFMPTPPTFQPSQRVIVVTDSSASSALQQKVEDLQRKLEESQQRQSVLELKLNQIISWIKSIFPLFR